MAIVAPIPIANAIAVVQKILHLQPLIQLEGTMGDRLKGTLRSDLLRREVLIGPGLYRWNLCRSTHQKHRIDILDFDALLPPLAQHLGHSRVEPLEKALGFEQGLEAIALHVQLIGCQGFVIKISFRRHSLARQLNLQPLSQPQR